jgi:nucleoside 2-deoxyribosyltransferase
MESPLQIYFAAPLFTLAEREWNLKLASLLKQELGPRFNIALPQLFLETIKDNEEIFKTCIRTLECSDIVIAIMDGSDPDSGTCFECGYACGIRIPIYTVRTDFRSCDVDSEEGFNLMLSKSSTGVVKMDALKDTTEDVAKELKELIFQDFSR